MTRYRDNITGHRAGRLYWTRAGRGVRRLAAKDGGIEGVGEGGVQTVEGLRSCRFGHSVCFAWDVSFAMDEISGNCSGRRIGFSTSGVQKAREKAVEAEGRALINEQR